MSKKKKIFFSSISLIVLFFCSYIYFSDSSIEKEENKFVYNNVEETLDGNIKIVLFTGDLKDNEFTVDNFKSKEKINILTQKVLSEILNKEGYSLSKREKNLLEYKRSSKSTLEIGAYYLGVQSENIALFKVNESGDLELKRVYEYPVSIIPQVDKEALEEFEYFHSKDMKEIEIKLSEFGVKF